MRDRCSLTAGPNIQSPEGRVNARADWIAPPRSRLYLWSPQWKVRSLLCTNRCFRPIRVIFGRKADPRFVWKCSELVKAERAVGAVNRAAQASTLQGLRLPMRLKWSKNCTFLTACNWNNRLSRINRLRTLGNDPLLTSFFLLSFSAVSNMVD
jgi:hypothetical protein